MPNLFSDLPVEIFACEPASTSGLTRTEMRAVDKLLPRAVQDRERKLQCGGNVDFIADQGRIEFVGEIGVGCGHQVGGAGVGGHAEHGNGIIERFGSVVYCIKDIAVDVNQTYSLANSRGFTPMHTDLFLTDDIRGL